MTDRGRHRGPQAGRAGGRPLVVPRAASPAGQGHRGGPPGRALDIGAAGGGNTRVLREHGWDAGRPRVRRGRCRGRARARARDAPRRRDAACRSPTTRSTSSSPSTCSSTSRTTTRRSPRCTGCSGRTGPSSSPSRPTRGCGPTTTSPSTTCAATRARRLSSVLHRGGFDVAAMTSWNVLLRPVVAMRAGTASGSDLEDLHPVVNVGAAHDHHGRALPTRQAACPASACSCGRTRAADAGTGRTASGDRRPRGAVTG